MTNHSVYEITLENELTGFIYFASQRLSKKPVLLPDNRVRNVRLNEEQWFEIHQELTPNEAAEILSNGGQFGFYGLHTRLAVNPGIAGVIEWDWRDTIGPILDSEFLENYYPKVRINIQMTDLRVYLRRKDDGPAMFQDKLGTVVSLKVQLQNPRPLRVRRFKLVTSGPTVTAQAGEIRLMPYQDIVGRHLSEGDDLYPNLADLNIDVDKNNITEGWLQFILIGVTPQAVVGFVVRLHVVDESNEEHKKDVTELRL